MTFTKKTTWVLLLLFLLIGFGLRFYHLGNTSLIADEFLDANATYGHFQTGEWQAWDWNHGTPSVRDNRASDERAWLYRIQVSGLYHFLEPSVQTIRLISVLWGTLTILIIYGVTYSLTRNRFIALLAAALWALSIPAIEINRKIRMYSMFAPVFLLFTWSFYIFLERGRRKIHTIGESGFWDVKWSFLVPTVVLGLLSLHLHLLTLNIAIAIFVYCVFRALHTSAWRARAFGRFTQYIFVAVIGMIALWVAQPPFLSAAIHIIGWEWNPGYITHLLSSFWHPLFGGVLLLGGLWHIFRAPHEPALLWIGTVFTVITALALLTWDRNTGEQYIFFMQPFVMIIVAIGVYAIGTWFLRRITHPYFTTFIFAGVLFFLPFYGYFFQENNTYHLTTSSGSVDYHKVLTRYFTDRVDPDHDVLVTRNFRNYYYSGAAVKVYDFGSERSAEAIKAEGKVRKITEKYLLEIMDTHPQGWMIYAENDEQFITREARALIAERGVKVTDSSLVRGDISVYRWGAPTSNTQK